MPSLPLHGRGSADNPANRFVGIHHESDPDLPPEERPAPATKFYRDTSRSIIAQNDSPDVGFTHSVNPYRGCEHGCAYCYARPTHEYFDLSAGLDFETRIFVKEDAPKLLRKELTAKSWKPTMLSFSGVTDCYQPIERSLKLTRQCLEVCAEFRNPVGIVTKNRLVARDSDVLRRLVECNAAAVFISITTLDGDLCGKLEPRASRPQARLDAIRELSAAGVPVGVFVAPVIPGLTDHEMPTILEAAQDAGARYAGKVVLRLPGAVAQLFENWLEQHVPTMKERVLGRVRELRGGRLNESKFGRRMVGEGYWADMFSQVFRSTAKKLGLTKPPELSVEKFRRPGERSLFDGVGDSH